MTKRKVFLSYLSMLTSLDRNINKYSDEDYNNALFCLGSTQEAVLDSEELKTGYTFVNNRFETHKKLLPIFEKAIKENRFLSRKMFDREKWWVGILKFNEFLVANGLNRITIENLQLSEATEYISLYTIKNALTLSNPDLEILGA